MRKYRTIIIIIVLFAAAGNFLSVAHAEKENYFEKAKSHQAMIPIKVVRTIRLPKGYHEGLHVEGNSIWVNNGENEKTWIVDFDSGKVLSEITPLGTFSEGITKDPSGKYWITDWNAKKLCCVTIADEKMAAEKEISLDPSYPTGVVWAGKHLYVITWTRGFGTAYHLLRMNEDGKILGKIKIKGIQEPSQITWDGKNLWISSWFQRRVYKIDEKTLSLKGYFRTNIEKTTGIAWDGRYLWLTGTNSDLYQIEVGE